MKPYRNRNGDAGVSEYEYGDTWIMLRFTRGGLYKYTSDGVGGLHINRMKRLADAGSGLTTFVNTHPEVKNGYSWSEDSSR